MNKLLLASHGPLAEGMKRTAEFLMGVNENVETICAYMDDESKDLPKMVEAWIRRKDPDDQWIVITDVFGGSINNEFMLHAQEEGYHLVAGMNLSLLLNLWYVSEKLTEKELEEIINESREGTVLCNKLLAENQTDREDEDF